VEEGRVEEEGKALRKAAVWRRKRKDRGRG